MVNRNRADRDGTLERVLRELEVKSSVGEKKQDWQIRATRSWNLQPENLREVGKEGGLRRASSCFTAWALDFPPWTTEPETIIWVLLLLISFRVTSACFPPPGISTLLLNKVGPSYTLRKKSACWVTLLAGFLPEWTHCPQSVHRCARVDVGEMGKGIGKMRKQKVRHRGSNGQEVIKTGERHLQLGKLKGFHEGGSSWMSCRIIRVTVERILDQTICAKA